MGPYVPLVDYPAVGSLTESSQAGDLPAESSCGQFPSGVFPSGNSTNITSHPSQFPVQYWNTGTASPPNLNCGNSTSGTFTPEIFYVATQFTTQVKASGEPGTGNPSPCAAQDTLTGGGSNSNPCIQIFAQAEQNNSTWQPPMPLTIVGQGFGYLSGVPWVGPSPAYVDIQAYSAQPPAGSLLWDTAFGTCQVYIADWTDSSISLLVGLPQNPENVASNPLSPATDMSPQTFFCLAAQGSYLQVKVTNPQATTNTGTLAAAQNVLAPGSTTPY